MIGLIGAGLYFFWAIGYSSTGSGGAIQVTYKGVEPYLKAFFWAGLTPDEKPGWYFCKYELACGRYALGVKDSTFPESPTLAHKVHAAVGDIFFGRVLPWEDGDWMEARLAEFRAACDSAKRLGKLDYVVAREIFWAKVLGHPEFRKFITPRLEDEGIEIVPERDWRAVLDSMIADNKGN
jgi:hypothetical protein